MRGIDGRVDHGDPHAASEGHLMRGRNRHFGQGVLRRLRLLRFAGFALPAVGEVALGEANARVGPENRHQRRHRSAVGDGVELRASRNEGQGLVIEALQIVLLRQGVLERGRLSLVDHDEHLLAVERGPRVGARAFRDARQRRKIACAEPASTMRRRRDDDPRSARRRAG